MTLRAIKEIVDACEKAEYTDNELLVNHVEKIMAEHDANHDIIKKELVDLIGAIKAKSAALIGGEAK